VIRGALTLTLLAGTITSPALGQVRVYRTNSAIGGDFRGYRSESGSFANSSRDYAGWFRVGLTGYWNQPDVLSFSANLSPKFSRSSLTGFEGTGPGSAQTLNYNLAAEFLRSGILSASAGAWQDDYFSRDPYGFVQDGSTGLWRGMVRFNSPLLPVTLQYTRSSFDLDRRYPNGFSAPVNEDLSDLLFTARNSKLNLIFQRVGRMDRIRGQQSTHTRGNLLHRLRWGTGSELSSTLNLSSFARQESRLKSSNLLWGERLSLRHASWISSSYNFRLLRSSSGADESRRVFGRVAATIKPDARIWVRGYVSSQSEQSRFSEVSRLRAGGEARTSFNLPAGGRLRLGLGTTYENSTVEATGEAWVPVVGEQHRVDASRTFLLDAAFVDPASILVRADDGTTEYTPGLDYRQTQVGTLVQIETLPGGRIAVGDLLLVDYRFRRLPDSGTSGTQLFLNANLSIRRFSAFVAGSKFDYDATTGQVPVLDPRNRDQLRFGVSYSLRTLIGQLSVQGMYELVRAPLEFDYTHYTVGATFAYDMGRSLSGSVGATLGRLEGELRPRRTTSFTAGIGWQPSAWFRLGGGAYYNDYREENPEFLRFDQQGAGGFATTSLVVGLWTLEVDLGLHRHQQPEIPSRFETRSFLKLTRAF
jgi:hypothetical protein